MKSFPILLSSISLLIGLMLSATQVTAQTCSGTTTITTASGSLDDGSGTSNYSNGLNCGWLIQPTTNPLRITLSMSSMNLNFGDRVRVYDGTNTGGTLIGNYTFNNTGNAIVAFSGSMFVQFTTNNFGSAQGWAANYTSATSYCQPNATYTANNDAFTDGTANGQNYLDSTDCQWLIQLPATPKMVVRLNFSRFSTHFTDTVKVYDGPTTSNALLGTFTGNTIPAAIVSTGTEMLLTFKSDSTTTANGWRAVYQAELPPTCTGNTVLTAANGTFDDGSSNPVANYTNNLNCSWLIQPAGATTVNLNFTQFDTEAGFDFVTVYDGANNSAPVIGSYSGTSIPLSITSSGSSLYVEFTSDQAVNESGWEATYNSTSNQCFSNLQLTALNGTLSDGSDTANYQNNLNCSWIIQPAIATSITANFNSFNISAGDTLYIYDGPNSSASLLGSYSGSTLPSAVTSTGGNMFIEFITDGTTNSSGWEISYNSGTPFSCAGQTNFTTAAGSFTDGSGTSNYDNNLNCSWLIQPAGAVSITLTLSSVSLTGFNDVVRIYDGANNGGTQIGTYRFNQGGTVTAFSGSMYLQFTTSNTNTAQGWSASYTSTNTICQPNTVLTANNGAFTDGTPNGTNYINNTNCEWLIQPTAANVAVRLGFSRFEIEQNADSVIIYDGRNTNDPVLARYTGNGVPPAVTSSGGDMLLTFKSNGSNVSNGWRAVYQTQAIPTCSISNNLIAPTDTFDDGSGPGIAYVQNSNCGWLISPPGALSIELKFHYFATEVNSDFVRVYDGTDNSGILLGSFSGSIIPSSVRATSGSMYVEFDSDGNTNLTGWEASYISSNVVTLDAVPDTVYINAGAGSTTSFALNSNITWTSTDNASWLIPNPINGTGNTNINLLAIQGNIGPERSAHVYYNSASGPEADTVVVIQRTSGRFISADPDTLYFDALLSSAQAINLMTNVNWTLTSTASWISITPSSGTNNGTPSVSVLNNLSNQIRTDFIVVSGNLGATNDTVFVVQDTIIASLSVNPDSLTLAQPANSGSSFVINSTVGWQTQSGASWLTVSNPAITKDTNTVIVTANSMNLGLNSRSSFIAVQDSNGVLFDTIYVDQEGGLLVLSATPDNVTLNQSSGSNASVNLDANLMWTASSAASWLSVSPTSGNDTTTLTISSLSANLNVIDRSSYVALEGGNGSILDTIFVDQEGVLPILSVNPSLITLAQIGNILDSFIVNSNLTWQLSSSSTWLTVNQPSSTTDSNTVYLFANSMNPTTNDRSTFIAIQDTAGNFVDTVFVIQEGILPVLTGTPDTLMLMAASGSSASFNITATHSWTAVEGHTWFSLDQTSGTGDTTVNISANSNNTSGSERFSTIVLTDAANNVFDTVIVFQDKIRGNININPNVVKLNFLANSSDTISLTSTVNWTIDNPASWLTVSPTNGSTSSSIILTANSGNTSGTDRIATLTVSGVGALSKNIMVTQIDGSGSTFEVSRDTVFIANPQSSSGTFSIFTNVGNWTLSDDASWLLVSPTSGSGTSLINVLAATRNVFGIPRYATITATTAGLPDRTVIVAQEGTATLFQATPNSLMIGADTASFGKFTISSNVPAWNITEGASWLDIDPMSGGFTLEITATAIEKNNSSAQRTEMVMVTAPPLVPLIIPITQDTVRAIGIKENAFESSFKLYPNPTSGDLTLKIGQEFVGYQVETKIYNSLGDEIPVAVNFRNSSTVKVNLNDYANGIYFLRVKYNGTVFSKRISIIK